MELVEVQSRTLSIEISKNDIVIHSDSYSDFSLDVG